MSVSPGKGGVYLMVWLFDPADRQPRGPDPNDAKNPVPERFFHLSHNLTRQLRVVVVLLGDEID
jgi:hypothetical protein